MQILIKDPVLSVCDINCSTHVDANTSRNEIVGILLQDCRKERRIEAKNLLF